MRQDPGRAPKSLAEARTYGNGVATKCGCCCRRGGRAETSNRLLGLAVAVAGTRRGGAGVRAAGLRRACRPASACRWCRPGRSVRELVHGAQDRKPSTPADAPRVAAELVAAQFETVAAAAEGCDALVATGLMPAGARTVAEVLGIPYVLAAFTAGELSVAAPRSRWRGRASRSRRARPTTGCCGSWTPSGVQRAVRRAAQRPPGGARPAARRQRPRPRLHRPPVAGGRPDAVLRGPVRRTSTWCRPARGSCPTSAHSRPTWRRSSTPARRRCTWASAACRCAPRRTPPGWRSRRSARRAAASILGRGWADLALIDDRDDCFVVGEVNQQALFARVAAVVHHGGAGTTTTAARAGAPQVVVPQIADQPYWASRAAALGIGTAHDGPTPTLESLSAALTTALTPAVHARASEVAGMIRPDGATVAAKMLLGL